MRAELLAAGDAGGAGRRLQRHADRARRLQARALGRRRAVPAGGARGLSQSWSPGLDRRAARRCIPDERIYTFWDYFRNAFARNAGLRIDHLLLSPTVAKRLVAAGVDRDVRGWEKTSDHAPVWIELKRRAGGSRRVRRSPSIDRSVVPGRGEHITEARCDLLGEPNRRGVVDQSKGTDGETMRGLTMVTGNGEQRARVSEELRQLKLMSKGLRTKAMRPSGASCRQAPGSQARRSAAEGPTFGRRLIHHRRAEGRALGVIPSAAGFFLIRKDPRPEASG